MTDLTPHTRIAAAETVVREQRAHPVRPSVWAVDGDAEAVSMDDYLDMEFELARLQHAVMGEASDHGSLPRDRDSLGEV